MTPPLLSLRAKRGNPGKVKVKNEKTVGMKLKDDGY